MAQHLREDVFVFSGFKTYRELREAANLLRDKNGLLKSFDRFYKWMLLPSTRSITAIG